MDIELFKHFPEGYDPRENQTKLLNQLKAALQTDKKFIVVNAPTGTGKSFLADTLAEASEEPTPQYKRDVDSYDIWHPMEGPDIASKHDNSGAAILTVTKNLQDQYLKDFKELNTLKGKSNYICNYDNEYDVETAPCNTVKGLKRQCWNCNRCDYYEDRNKVFSNQVGVFNYDVWMHIPEYARQKEVLICDEASELENFIISHFSLDVNYEALEKIFELKKYPRLESEKPKDGMDWLRKLNENLKSALEEWKEVAEGKSSLKKKAINKVKVIERLLLKISKVIDNVGKNGENGEAVEYVIELTVPDKWNPDVKEGVLFTPLRANKLANKLFRTADRVILLSATIIDHKKEMMDLGVNRDQYVYIEAPSAFDPKKSPIYIFDNFPLTYGMIDKNLPKVTTLVDRIINKHDNQKGLIHTVSFKITKAVEENVQNSRLIFREAGKTNDMLLKEHSETDDPTVMVSPSMSHGVDLKGSLGEFQIIMKVPYLPLSSKRIKILSKDDYRWYVNKTLSTLVQMAGRCTRNEDDKAVTYIVDGSAAKLIRQNWNKLPKYFVDRIV